MNVHILTCFVLATFPLSLLSPQGAGQDDKILERGDKLLEEAKAAYEEARSKNSVASFVDAGFKLEEARIKFIVVQEIGTPERQKAAADRLRVVNQLGKLIHDGKVAVNRPPSEAPPPAPVPPPVEDPAAKPDARPAKAPVDVTARHPVPDAAKLRESEKLIKELYKDQFAKKAPADRQALAKALLEQAVKTRDDPPALWVLYREAVDAATQACDLRTSAAAIEAMTALFDVDALPLQQAAWTSAGKSAKTPVEFAAVADAFLYLADDLVAADQYDAADKAASAAQQHARKAADPGLAARAGVTSKEIAEAKAKFLAMRGALETLARNPDDAGANSQMGQFLCFVKGNWDLGLRFIVKGSDAALKALGEKELAAPVQSSDRAALADGWFELSEKEKSFLCKKQLHAHARSVYESALPDASGLLRARIEKRLEQLQALATAGPASLVDATTLTPKKSTVGFYTLGVNTNANNLAVFVQGKECKQYLFTHAPSSIVYELPPRTRMFTAVGAKLDKNAAHITGSWKHLVYVDGKQIYESKPLSEAKGAELEISVTLPPGAKEIELRIDDMGDKGSDWAVWAYPRFVR